MAHSLHWPSRHFFYPIGNTSAVNLARDLAPGTSANILLLGCGDPRNVLYTVYCEPLGAARKLDFTCCDSEGAVLARNVLLLSLVMDDKPQDAMWNIFYHMKLDRTTHDLLVEQSRSLADNARSLESWRSSRYGAVLKISTQETLVELRRLWLLYAGMNALPSPQLSVITKAFNSHRTSALRLPVVALGHARSAGPCMQKALDSGGALWRAYWTDGMLSTDRGQLASAAMLNPTFVYSRGRNASCVQYALCPTAGFHLDAVYGSARRDTEPTINDIIKAVTGQFAQWCTRFRSQVESDQAPIVRLLWSDALAVAPCLHAFRTTGTLGLGAPLSQWTTRELKLDADEYVAGCAPAAFDIVDTSNLTDDIGLLNVVIASAPLLASSQGVLYTESLLFVEKDATKEFRDLLHGDLATTAFLIGLCPVDYLSGFSSISNVHELRTQSALPREDRQQFHVLTAWRAPASCDVHYSNGPPPAVDSRQLATFLYDVYRSMFEQENPFVFTKINSRNLPRAMAMAFRVPYTRETFTHLARSIKMRFRLDSTRWSAVLDRFWRLKKADQPSMIRDFNNSYELWAHLRRFGLLSASDARMPARPVGPFARWARIPELVRVVMVVPRSRLTPLLNLGEDSRTPPIVCFLQLKGKGSQVFSSIHVAFGTITQTGTSARPGVRFDEDALGWDGSDPLVVSFIMPSSLEADINALEVHLAVMDTPSPATPALLRALGPGLTLFHARLADDRHVHLIPFEESTSTATLAPSSGVSPGDSESYTRQAGDIGTVGTIQVALDEQCETLHSMTCQIDVSDNSALQALRDGSSPKAGQISPCTIRVELAGRFQDVVFPYPVNGSALKLQPVQESQSPYIGIVVPPSGGLEDGGMRLNRFPVIVPGADPSKTYSWSMHRINMSILPSVDTSNRKLKTWLDPHIQNMLSEQERSVIRRPAQSPTSQTDVDFAGLKETLRDLFVRLADTRTSPGRGILTFVDDAAEGRYMYLFVNDLRHDLSAHTLICDAYILLLPVPLSTNVIPDLSELSEHVEPLVLTPGVLMAWISLLPASAERCRAWEHTVNCEYTAQRRIPLTNDLRGELAPLCSCGLGKDVEGRMATDPLWKPFAPYVTRIAVSPLFAVPYLERVVRDPTLHRCALCRGIGKPKLKECSSCNGIRYCSRECQKADWKEHKPHCRRR